MELITTVSGLAVAVYGVFRLLAPLFGSLRQSRLSKLRIKTRDGTFEEFPLDSRHSKHLDEAQIKKIIDLLSETSR